MGQSTACEQNRVNAKEEMQISEVGAADGGLEEEAI